MKVLLKKSSKLVLAMIAILVCLNLMGKENVVMGETSGDWEYSVEGDAVTIIRYSGSEAEITIPSSINGKSVTSIGNWAFHV